MMVSGFFNVWFCFMYYASTFSMVSVLVMDGQQLVTESNGKASFMTLGM